MPRRQASEQSCVDVFETRRSRAWSFLAMRESSEAFVRTLFSWLVEATLLLLSHIFIYFLPLVDWYCQRPFNNREIEDWRPSVLGYCLLQDISPNMCAYTLSIDACIRWHSATLGIWISEARSLRWMSRICSIVATPIYFLQTKAKLERSDSKFAALSFPGCNLFSDAWRDWICWSWISCHVIYWNPFIFLSIFSQRLRQQSYSSVPCRQLHQVIRRARQTITSGRTAAFYRSLMFPENSKRWDG